MERKQLALGPLGTNGYILYQNQEALLVDPGGDAEKVIEFLQEKSLTPKAILLTHAHFDHIGAVEELRNEYNLPVYLHEQEASWLANPDENGSSLLIGKEIVTGRPDFSIQPGHIEIASFRFEALHTPGHSPGSISFLFRDQGFIVSGDILFQQGIGRTDLPGGDMEKLKKSIRDQLYYLEDSLTVLPGHGPETTIGYERRHNPFVRAV
ncbi:MBL fold metallo-hydrolase [Lentibacillus sediminis]|uniref:MBL fold metallo-hydrolase n=1 Tax=Lentibacillus sediminis TaxID=1940529 RepID=UPI000C1C4692|nr:MBL fold metallo-hydrolase [Lentibacillus sediminis]